MKVLILVSVIPAEPNSSMNWSIFKDEINDRLKHPHKVEIASLSELEFMFATKAKSSVYVPRLKKDLKEFDLVIFRRIGDKMELAISAANYLRVKNIKFIDSYIPQIGSGKLACSSNCVLNDLPTPLTLFARAEQIANTIEKSDLKFPVIIKADKARKGQNNYLAKDINEIADVISSNPGLGFVVQEFIPNDGDYRILVLNSKIALTIKRTSTGDSHLNNTSQGGQAELVEAPNFSPKVFSDVLAATDSEKLEVAGVDLIINNQTGKHYILEVNRAPQLNTGSFTKEKMNAYSTMIEELLG